jgi:hypothetical protein
MGRVEHETLNTLPFGRKAELRITGLVGSNNVYGPRTANLCLSIHAHRAATVLLYA